jgi:hypothetical protein
MDKKE